MRIPLSALLLGVLAGTVLPGQAPPKHGSAPKVLQIRNVHVVRGDGTPAHGPTDVLIEDGVITVDGTEFGGRSDAEPDAVIDGEGRYLLPGFVSTHAHIQQAAAGIPMPREYQLDLWLACGITAIRDVGSAFSQSLRIRSDIEKGRLAGPRIFLYQTFGEAVDRETVAARCDNLRRQGADGIKLWSNYSYTREQLGWIFEGVQRNDLPVTAHIGIGPTDVVDYASLGLDSVEHWYGIPDAALDGVQTFPADFSYSNEVHRFRYAGRLWREADPQRLRDVLAFMVEQDVAWSPTLAIYEASRDLTRAQNKPWFDEHLHPALEAFFSPNLDYHGSYFLGWTTEDEVFWKENYELWMAAVRDFARMGGVVTTGEDAGFIYVMYGFGLLRELELHLEAGFQPLEVIRHATFNGAQLLRQGDVFGQVRRGMRADLVLVDGNPLQNLKLLYPTGTTVLRDGKPAQAGGILYTIVDGRVHHVPTLMQEVRTIVREARADRR